MVGEHVARAGLAAGEQQSLREFAAQRRRQQQAAPGDKALPRGPAQPNGEQQHRPRDQDTGRHAGQQPVERERLVPHQLRADPVEPLVKLRVVVQGQRREHPRPHPPRPRSGHAGRPGEAADDPERDGADHQQRRTPPGRQVGLLDNVEIEPHLAPAGGERVVDQRGHRHAGHAQRERATQQHRAHPPRGPRSISDHAGRRCHPDMNVFAEQDEGAFISGVNTWNGTGPVDQVRCRSVR
ncbi:hypothetical protein [Actinokineospora sp.]|uniref:hypothetical protein n=1 Tax=Actinokineospora sp. TaxID=1872133 RepID=UPI0040377EDB